MKYTDESVYVLFECGVVALFRVVEMNEEKNVGPDVMFLVYVLLKTLHHNSSRNSYDNNGQHRL